MKREILSDEVRARIEQYVRAGIPRRVAALGAGISSETFEMWMQRGERASRGKYRALYDAVTVAEALYEGDLVAELYKSVQQNARIGFGLLERRHPETYGRQRLFAKREDPRGRGAPQRLLLPAEEALRAVPPRRRSGEGES